MMAARKHRLKLRGPTDAVDYAKSWKKEELWVSHLFCGTVLNCFEYYLLVVCALSNVYRMILMWSIAYLLLFTGRQHCYQCRALYWLIDWLIDCISYGLSVRPSARLSVCHIHAGTVSSMSRELWSLFGSLAITIRPWYRCYRLYVCLWNSRTRQRLKDLCDPKTHWQHLIVWHCIAYIVLMCR